MEDAQQEHDLKMMGKEIRFEKDSAKKLGAMLKKKRPVLTAHDPVSSIVKNHPTLTEERAAEIIESYGF